MPMKLPDGSLPRDQQEIGEIDAGAQHTHEPIAEIEVGRTA